MRYNYDTLGHARGKCAFVPFNARIVCGVHTFVKKPVVTADAFAMRNVLIVLLWSVAAASNLVAEESVLFRFSHRVGEQYRIVGVNRQNLFVDGIAVGEAEVLTRVLIALEDDRVVHARYQISEEADVGAELFATDHEYEVRFHQEPNGDQTVPSAAFVPQVQSVPTFPVEPIRPGERWSRPGMEVYDFREGIGIEQPLRVPINVHYEYAGPTDFEERGYQEVKMRYTLFHRPREGSPEADEIRLMTARFSQRLLWDAVADRPAYYDETYTLFIQFTDGTRMESRGTADGRVVDAPELDRESVRNDIAQAIIDLDLPDTTVRSDEEGVTIGLEDIRFAPDSAQLMDTEIEKLEWVASILREYPDRDVLITGHTALAGTPEGRQRLSEERAAAVGRYLIEQGVRTRDQLMYRGRGAGEPVASNDTFEGRRRNRRVEITIREN